jgi:hypothetical protein
LTLAYRQHFEKSARRHLDAAQVLYGINTTRSRPSCRAVAGYLFGIAGEIAVKQMMRASGMKELSPDQRRDDPFYAHFQVLKTYLARTVMGRLAGDLRKIAEDPRLFQNWDTDIRYAPTTDIEDRWVEAWKTDAETLVEKMCLP